VPFFPLTRASGQLGTSAKDCVALVLVSKFASSLPESPALPRTHWKPRTTREERESDRAQISQKNFGWRTPKGRTLVGETLKGNWESVSS